MSYVVELKFRKKGQVTTRELPEMDIPDILRPPGHLSGVDMTAYPVISVTAGRHGDEKAQEVFRRAGEKVTVLYEYSWRNGWGQGVFLPKDFNPGRLEFYQSARATAEKEKVAVKTSEDALARQIESAFPQVSTFSRSRWGGGGVEVKPAQETFADWAIIVQSWVEAEAAIRENEEEWSAWNRRALNLYTAEGLPNPGTGNIQIHPAPRHGTEKVGIKLRPADENRQWAIFARDEAGKWQDTGERCRSAPR